MHVCAIEFDLHIPAATSLKAKRSVLNSLIARVRNKFPVAIAEVDHQDSWQRCILGVSAVSGSAHQVTEILDEVERLVWAIPEIEVGSANRHWLELDA